MIPAESRIASSRTGSAQPYLVVNRILIYSGGLGLPHQQGWGSCSSCPDKRSGMDAAPAQDGVEKLRSVVSSTPSLRYLSHLSSTAASSGFCKSAVGPGSIQNRSLSVSP